MLYLEFMARAVEPDRMAVNPDPTASLVLGKHLNFPIPQFFHLR